MADSYWPALISECIEESFRLAGQAEDFVHDEMIPQLFEKESVDDRQAFFDKIDFDLLRQTAPKLWERLSKEALDVEQTIQTRQQRIQMRAQQAAMANPPDALSVMQHLFGAPAGVDALKQLDQTESKQDDAFQPQLVPRPVLGLKLPSQRGAGETAGQGLENTLPMGGA